MKKIFVIAVLLSSISVFAVEQTVCFSQYDTGQKIGNKAFYMASLGDNITLNGGQCKGATLPEMNKKGWELIQVVTGLESSFGMVFKKNK